MVCYALWLFFQLKTHREIFEYESVRVNKRVRKNKGIGDAQRVLARAAQPGGIGSA
jgi:Ca2+/H+ antiporter